MRISDWSSDVCSSDLSAGAAPSSSFSLRRLRPPLFLHRLGDRGMPSVAFKIIAGMAAAGEGEPVPSEHLQINGVVAVGVNPVEALHFIGAKPRGGGGRSEEHTSELQSLMRISYAVFCLQKKTNQKSHTDTRL